MDYIIQQDTKIEQQYNILIKHIYSNNGSKFINLKLQIYIREKGII